MMGKLQLHAVLTVLTVLTTRRGLTHAVQAPSNVSVKCDSYGVTVEWMATGLSEQADFLLEIKPDFGKVLILSTKYPRYNISDLLEETAYNRYFAKVKARDGGNESEFTESQIFAYNSKKQRNIPCDLEFPEVSLFPRDGKLFVKFVNPLHLYRDTPALRNLLSTDTLLYTLTSNKVFEQSACSLELSTCESFLSFPEEQEEYCITLQGTIRQTDVQKTKPYCYQGTLNPGPPLTEVLPPVLAGFAGILTLMLITWFLVKEVNKGIKKKNLSKFPKFLEKFPHNGLTPPLKVEPELMAENLIVEPAAGISPTTPLCLQESTTHPDSSANSFNSTVWPGDQDTLKSSESSSQSEAERLYMERLKDYGNGAELSGSDLSTGYDRPHAHLEMSPCDMVTTYGS